jgi:hypothetical protein
MLLNRTVPCDKPIDFDRINSFLEHAKDVLNDDAPLVFEDEDLNLSFNTSIKD